MDNRIHDWKSKTLSFAGKVQMIQSVLAAMHVYWVSFFILPSSIINLIEQKMRNFLWSKGNSNQGKAKVAWRSVCLPKQEGGLGLRLLSDSNKALITNHIFSILSNRQSLWVKWVKDYKLKNRSLWDVRMPSNCPWSWKKILIQRHRVRGFFWFVIGDGRTTFALFDNWCMQALLCNFILHRAIMQAGWSIYTKVADLSLDGQWQWPLAWLDMFPVLLNIPATHLQNGQDRIMWQDNTGHKKSYSSFAAWEEIRQRAPNVDWAHVVWFPHCIPKHAFMLWLICRRNIVTQDKIQKWNNQKGYMDMICCLLCKQSLEDHVHLFFKCGYSLKVWKMVCRSAHMDHRHGNWNDIMHEYIQRGKSRSIDVVIHKLLLAASAYYLWQERNHRYFYDRVRPPEGIVEVIMATVRMKLATLKFRSTDRVRRRLREWNLPLTLS